MEELNLSDLAEAGANFELFPASDDELNSLGKPAAGGDDPKPADTKTKEQLSEDEKAAADKAAEDAKATDPESVAKDKDNTQVQAGKTATADEGSDSSSPKLNETEQLYSNLATKFKAEGVLPGLEDTTKIKTLKDLEDAMRAEITNGLTERQKALEEAKNVGLPVSEISEQMELIDKLEKIDDSYVENDDNIEFRRTAITQDFLSKGYDAERAATMAQRSIDAGTDVEDAKFALKAVIGVEKTNLQNTIQAAKDKETKNITDLKTYIDTNKEVIPGIKLSDAQGEELYKQITTDLGNKENAFMQAQKKDPTGSRVKLEAIFYLTKGLTDFSVFGNAKESEISDNIENLLRGTSFTKSGKVNTDVTDDNANFTLKDLKDLKIE